MSQNRGGRSGGGSGNRGGANRGGQSRGSQPSRGTGGGKPSRQAVTRVPAQQARGSMRASIDRVLPPFSVRRYVAIWAVGTAVLVGLLLFLLLRPGSPPSTPPGAVVATPTVLAADAIAPATPGATDNPLASPGTVTAGPTSAPSTGGQAGSTGGKYMVIETAKGKIVCKLATDQAAGVPKTIANFEQKANSGFFNGLVFHRVEDWVIQGGDPQGTGAGGGKMPSEYNQLHFDPGALGVARGPDPALNSDSQFFIVKNDANFLNGQYTNFGQVVEGMDVVKKIAIGDKMLKVTVEERK